MRGRCELDGQRLGKVAREIGLDGASASTPFLCFSKPQILADGAYDGEASCT